MHLLGQTSLGARDYRVIYESQEVGRNGWACESPVYTPVPCLHPSPLPTPHSPVYTPLPCLHPTLLATPNSPANTPLPCLHLTYLDG
ncbi:hypothetical protein Pmani_030632 [Petrolisthes manimaculis]|uniref:Uncharacterized protein n=1 Tax=Petrolisthes manimaculis TaxID=1843537 RepID=A0AAE1NWR8_9EUCA|nr:hypothetical protein Pmani_030632 [Petrolisthes manimaculis]